MILNFSDEKEEVHCFCTEALRGRSENHIVVTANASGRAAIAVQC
jgi:hypothetical protein